MCQNPRHNALGFLGVSSMLPLSKLTPKAESLRAQEQSETFKIYLFIY